MNNTSLLYNKNTIRTITRMLESRGFEVCEVRRYSRSVSLGYSVMRALGFRYVNSMPSLFLVAAGALGALLSPLSPFMPDFLYVTARKLPQS